MRIAIWNNLPSGGGKRAMFDQIRGLVASGHSVKVWCPPTADRSYLDVAAFADQEVVPMFGARRGVWVRRWLRDAPEYASVKAMRRHSLQVVRRIDAYAPDILLVHPCRTFRVTPLAKYARHLCPTVLYLQEPYRWYYEALPRQIWEYPLGLFRDGFSCRKLLLRMSDPVLTHRRRRRVGDERRNAAAYDRILVNSLYSRESVLRAYGIDSRVCYLGVDTEAWRRLPIARRDVVVGLGAFAPEKRIEHIIASVALMSSPKPTITWIGNTGTQAYVKALGDLAARLGVELDIRMRISDHEVRRLLSSAFAMPYAPRLEPFGLAPLEAASCELPVVAIAEGGVRETVIHGETGFLVGSSAHEMAAALQRLRDDAQLVADLGSAARSRVERQWTLAGSHKRLEEQLREALGEAAGHRALRPASPSTLTPHSQHD